MKLADICIRQSQYSKAIQIVDALFAKVSVQGLPSLLSRYGEMAKIV